VAKRLLTASRIVIAGILSASLCACGVLDKVEGRASAVNETSEDYASQAILLNIVRASRFEPLNFAAFTAFTGHDTVSAAAPSITWPPSGLPTIGVGNTTVSGVESNDFNVNVLDDPGSYSALLSPLNAATIGLFIRQGYPRQLLYMMTVDYIEEPSTSSIYYNNPDPDINLFPAALSKINTYAIAGLTVATDNDAMASPTKYVPGYLVCFDPLLPIPGHKTPDERYGGYSPLCNASSNTWTQARSGDPSAKNTDSNKEPLPVAYYTFVEPKNNKEVQLHTKTVYGIYEYLGALLRANIPIKIPNFHVPDDTLFTVTSELTDCFVSVDYEGQHYCVPNRASNTKRIFALLRQLMSVLTVPSGQSATQTVRTTP
jgi:hypothetical protein